MIIKRSSQGPCFNLFLRHCFIASFFGSSNRRITGSCCGKSSKESLTVAFIHSPPSFYDRPQKCQAILQKPTKPLTGCHLTTLCCVIAQYWCVGQKKSMPRGGGKLKPKLDHKVSYLRKKGKVNQIYPILLLQRRSALRSGIWVCIAGTNNMCRVALSKGKKWKFMFSKSADLNHLNCDGFKRK